METPFLGPYGSSSQQIGDDLPHSVCVAEGGGGGTGELWKKISLVNMRLCVIPGPIIIDAYWQSLGLEPTLRAEMWD